MRKLILNAKGQGAVLLVTVVVAVAGTAMTFLMSNNKSTQNEVTKNNQRVEGQILVDKLKTLASYLVSSNIIICKEKPFSGSTEGKRCAWSGVTYSKGQSDTIHKSRVGFDEGYFDKKGFLVFNVDTSKIVKDDELQTEEYELVGIKGKLAFKLYDFASDELKIAKSFGGIPVEFLNSDMDRTIVLVRVEVNVGEKFQRKESIDDNGKRSVTRKKLGGFTIKNYFGIRRPIAIPLVAVSTPSCAAGCRPGLSLDDSSVCRSNESFTFSDKVEVKGTITNKGPGVLYDLVLEKQVSLNSKLYPGVSNPKYTAVDVLASSPQGYLLPGQTATWTDSVKCRTYQTQSAVRCRENDRQCLAAAAKRANKKTISQHSTGGGQINYKLNFPTINKAAIKSDKLGFEVDMKPLITSSTLSRIEPLRVATKVEQVKGIPVREENSVNIIVIPTH